MFIFEYFKIKELIQMNENKTNINWYPGHMAKTKREIREKLDLIDIVYEVIDARMPISSRLEDVNDITRNKKKIIIWNLVKKKKMHISYI